jgi:hypothetical protein
MSIWHIYKTKRDVIIAIGLSTDDEGTTRITVLDHNIPPSPAEFLTIFQADSQRDYVHNMIPVLLANLKDDSEVVKIYERIKKEEL